jgi:hypothetical protein
VQRTTRRYRCPLASWVAVAYLAAGCSGPAEPVGPNHACFRALDCEDGLVCVQGRCTSDIRAIVPEGAGPPPPTAAVDAGSR